MQTTPITALAMQTTSITALRKRTGCSAKQSTGNYTVLPIWINSREFLKTLKIQPGLQDSNL